ncbi:MAG: acyl carrier protein [Candidatus Omnitrophica bacterium]|nr:acyl carrier protein [Candidatus Omnitrophota bacterium]
MKKSTSKKIISAKKNMKAKNKITRIAKGVGEGEIRKEVLEIVSNLAKLPKEKIEKYNKDDFNELGLDSFTLVEIDFSIENTFDIDIPQDSLPGIKNFNDLVTLIQTLVKKRG